MTKAEGIMHIRSASEIRKQHRYGGLSLFDGVLSHKNGYKESWLWRIGSGRIFTEQRKRMARIHNEGLAELRPSRVQRHLARLASNIMSGNNKPGTGRHIAVEIECVLNKDHEEVAKAMALAGLKKYVKVKHDGSIRAQGDQCAVCSEGCQDEDGSNDCDADNGECNCSCECERGNENAHAAEIVVCAHENDIAVVIEKTCKVLNDQFSAEVNKSCGLHVHIDMRRRDYEAAFSKLVKQQRLLYSMVPTTRVKNSYCKPTSTTVMDTARNRGRYQGINPESYGKHRTIEVRLHSGTTNPVKIGVWVRLLMAIVKRKSDSSIDSIDSLVNMVGLMDGMYIVDRLKKFSGSHGEKGWLAVAKDAARVATDRDNEAA